MAALAASGRTVEALRVFDDFRRLLGDELGIEPSPALVAQHAALLAGTEHDRRRPARSQLPSPATSLIGREALLAESWSGSSPSGWSRWSGPAAWARRGLLVELGHRLQARRPDRPVVMCELARPARSRLSTWWRRRWGSTADPARQLVERIVDVLGDDE